MVDYVSQHQTKFIEFGTIHQMKLNKANRWIKMADHLPWDNLVKLFTRDMSDLGRKGVCPRMVIGCLVIKHKLGLSDEETVLAISENPYMQYFLGLDDFLADPPFSASLFVEWRKQAGNDMFNSFTEVLQRVCMEKETGGKGTDGDNKGKLKLDATVADQHIAYPNDLGLLNRAREKTEGMVDLLYGRLRGRLPAKPRTYRKVARKRYLAEAKKKRGCKASRRKAIRYMLNCLDRNIGHIERMLDMLGDDGILGYKRMRQLWVIRELNAQQRKMYDEKSDRCDDRIVSIAQPHVRPIVRGKQGRKVEFGAKLGISLAGGFAKAETVSWDAYHEGGDLIPHAQAYKELHGHYPELIQVDRIYGTNKNRKWCSERGIRMTVTPKGPKKEMTAYQKRKHRKELSERNGVEGKIGQAKEAYGLNEVKAKRPDTSQSWIGIILFVTNLVQFASIMEFKF